MTETGSLLGRAATIGRVLAKQGLKARDARTPRERAKALRGALEELGPTFAKLGQILSTRPDLLPPEFIQELASLQDHVPPLTEEQVVGVMEAELGVPWEDVFASIEPTPLAAGTIGQVHKATLEGGARVVVKVQRPDAEEQIMRDLGLMELFAEKVEGRDALSSIIDLPAAIAHLSSSLRRELDFRQEAANCERLREVLQPFDHLEVPAVHKQLSTARLLVLDLVPGGPIKEAPQGPERKDAARQLLESFYRQILVDGFFHADPHPGNLMWSDGKIWFLDVGMVGEVEPRMRELLVLMILAFWQGDTGFLAEVVLLLAEKVPPDLDVPRFEAELDEVVAKYRGASLQEIELGPLMQGITELAGRHGVRLPASLALTGKALAQMQLATAELDPTLDPMAVASKFLLRDYLRKTFSGADPKRLFYEGRKFSTRVTRLVEAVETLSGARPGKAFQVEFRGTAPLEATIRVATRRLALAGLSAAAIVGASVTAAASAVDEWVPLTLGSAAAVLSTILLEELLRR